jgi:REP element-mobilizing transposase RayT
MTAPRQILPGTVYLVTRRCVQRERLLHPSKVVNQLFGYLLAVAAKRFGIHVHAFCVLSNHFHLVLTDPEARLPAFGQYLDSLLARSINAALGRREHFWAPSSYSAVTLVDRDDVVDKTAYVLANPVAAGLVPRAREWPGLWSPPASIGGMPLSFARSERFFRPNGQMPKDAVLQLTAPPGFESAEDFRRRVERALAAREDEAAGIDGERKFLGVERALIQATPGSRKAHEPLRGLNPRVAARDRGSRVAALMRLVEFLRSYREARSAFLAGVANVLFPAGTYLLRVAFGVACEPAG